MCRVEFLLLLGNLERASSSCVREHRVDTFRGSKYGL